MTGLLQIEFTLERKTDAFISKDGVTALRCSRIRILPYTSGSASLLFTHIKSTCKLISDVPPLVLQPLLVIQARSNRSSMSFALTGNGELVALHPQLATYDNMLKRVVSGECNERSHVISRFPCNRCAKSVLVRGVRQYCNVGPHCGGPTW